MNSLLSIINVNTTNIRSVLEVSYKPLAHSVMADPMDVPCIRMEPMGNWTLMALHLENGETEILIICVSEPYLEPTHPSVINSKL